LQAGRFDLQSDASLSPGAPISRSAAFAFGAALIHHMMSIFVPHSQV
jgi:hypothetical protein